MSIGLRKLVFTEKPRVGQVEAREGLKVCLLSCRQTQVLAALIEGLANKRAHYNSRYIANGSHYGSAVIASASTMAVRGPHPQS